LVEGVDGTEVTYLDTHVLLRLFLGDLEKLSAPALRTIEEEDLVASPAAVLELEFLHETGRLQPTASKLIGVLEHDLALRVCELPFRTVVEHALKENWSRDPFDRLIVGNAKANDATLVTKDEKILRHYARAIW
jgi:PIN domain nuclease of toxin-antitoxin system